MYIASIFNRKGLFQHVGGWMSKCEITEQHDLQVFLFRATSALLNFNRMYVLSQICVEQYRERKQHLENNCTKIVFWSPTFVELLNEFSPFLSAMRIMQNMILPLAARAKKLKCSMPSSLAEGMKKLDSYGLGDDICSVIREYWNGNGKEIKGYRDIDQHFYTIIEHSFLQISPEEKVLVYLPDNPEERSASRVSFASERDALPYFQNSFLEIHRCIENILSVLGFQPSPLGQAFGLAQLGLLTEEVKKTLALIVDDNPMFSGLEFFQSEDRAILMRSIPPKVRSNNSFNPTPRQHSSQQASPDVD
jgi:hypothetical protein